MHERQLVHQVSYLRYIGTGASCMNAKYINCTLLMTASRLAPGKPLL